MKKSGLTLLEVMVSMVILSISVAGMLAALTVGRKNINVPDHRIAALNYAQQTLEGLKGKVGVYNITPGRGDLNQGTYGVVLPAGEIKDDFGGTGSYTVTNIGGNDDGDTYQYKKVTVTVSWTEPD